MAEISIPQTIDPTSRLRSLGQLGSNVAIENEVPARRYLRSASEMERMANVYLEEGNLEHAFLYTKLITLLHDENNEFLVEALNRTSEVLIAKISKDLCTVKPTQHNIAAHYERFEVRLVSRPCLD